MKGHAKQVLHVQHADTRILIAAGYTIIAPFTVTVTGLSNIFTLMSFN